MTRTGAGNLTRQEARRRARLIEVLSYRVELDLTRPASSGTFGSVSEVRFRCRRPGGRVFIDLAAPAVTEISLNGRALCPHAFTGDRIELPGLAAENELRVVAECGYSDSGEGLTRFTDPADGGVYLHSNFEPFSAHRVYACFDQPDLKSRLELVVDAPEGWRVFSTMAPAVAGPVRWHFPSTPPLPTYVTAVAAGPYHEIRGEHEGIPLGLACRASLAGYLDPGEIFGITGQGLDFYQRVFGVRYPFAKYDQIFVPESRVAGLENAGCVMLTDGYVFRSRVTDVMRERRAGTILHELAHMWFGDLITMRWWDDLWLNESFATWAAALATAEATRWSTAWTTFAQEGKGWAYRQDQLPSTHPVVADIPDIDAVELNFDGITYAKGAAVLKQLLHYVGREQFLAGLRRYFASHAWGNATLADLLTALEDSSGRDMSAWSGQWLRTAGVNTLRPELAAGASAADRYPVFEVRQEAPAAHPTLRTHRVAIGLYDLVHPTDSAGRLRLVRRQRVETDVAGGHTVIPELAGSRVPDLLLLNDDDLGYAKIRLDQRSLATLVEHIGDFADPLPAALCWAAAWDMCRDAELAARDYVTMVSAGIRSVTEISVVQALLRQAAAAARTFADPAWRDTGLTMLAETSRRSLDEAEPGSDAQLSFVLALAGVATSAEHLALLGGLLDGSVIVDGLAVDTALRWGLLYRLVARGSAGRPEIGAELARDRTDVGRLQAAACEAAIPDPAAKAAGWKQIVAGTLPGQTFRAVLTGFADGERPDLLKPYMDEYFELVGGIWRSWPADMAQAFASVAFPAAAPSVETIEATDAYLARPGLPPGLRRVLAERRDALARALRCQAGDREAASFPVGLAADGGQASGNLPGRRVAQVFDQHEGLPPVVHGAIRLAGVVAEIAQLGERGGLALAVTDVLPDRQGTLIVLGGGLRSELGPVCVAEVVEGESFPAPVARFVADFRRRGQAVNRVLQPPEIPVSHAEAVQRHALAPPVTELPADEQ